METGEHLNIEIRCSKMCFIKKTHISSNQFSVDKRILFTHRLNVFLRAKGNAQMKIMDGW